MGADDLVATETIDGDTHTANTPSSAASCDQGGDVGLGGLGFEQGVVDEPRPLLRRLGRGIRTALQAAGVAARGSHHLVRRPSGRHGSRFQLVLPGWPNSANRKWQTNCSRMPGMSASGASASTSPQASSVSDLVPSWPAASLPDSRRIDPQAGQVAPVRPFDVVDERRRGRRVGRCGARKANGSSDGRAPAARNGARGSARLPLDLEQLGPDVDQVDAGGDGGDRDAGDTQDQRRAAPRHRGSPAIPAW